ncbi:uncharacterized protein LOC129589156 [Paramacrobiotus metropolitanus]|uniref:uncharacterized protein LOC129589156 n=1 Tax=Paramacrobiotus metropolitanus TaxID=2943436 RepID=UPI0024459528|nr:uncharacterized protein LOC129589156 [Paramacrobiotus metropolitanus]
MLRQRVPSCTRQTRTAAAARERSRSQPASSRVFKQPARRPKPQPVWNDNQTDLDAYRATTAERKQRHISRTSKNLGAARVELQEQKIRNELRREGESKKLQKHGAIVKEVSVSMVEIVHLLDETDRVLREAQHLLKQHKAGAVLDLDGHVIRGEPVEKR